MNSTVPCSVLSLLMSSMLMSSVALRAQAPVAPAEPATDQLAASSKTETPQNMDAITSERLIEHAMYLASSELGGRLTGSPGQKAAAKYIADKFESWGLEPLGDEGENGKSGYVQNYPLKRTRLVMDTTFLEWGGERLSDGFAVISGPRAKDVAFEGELAFVGRGRTRGDNKDVPDGFDFDSNIPVVMLPKPRGNADRALTIEQKFGMAFQSIGFISRNAAAMQRKGAKAVVMLLPEDGLGFGDVLNYLALSPGKDVMTAAFKADDGGSMAISTGIPVIVLSPKPSKALLAALKVDLEDASDRFDDEEGVESVRPSIKAGVSVTIERDQAIDASNVVAVLRGSDPELSKQAIVYSAHMDHVGRRYDGEIFNGADDNASGSAGLLEIAHAFATAKVKPKRSIIFLSVSGEELGLWGSEYYSMNSTWPLDKIIADVNTDMIGRSGPEADEDEITVTPSFRHEMFSDMVQKAAELAQHFDLTFTDGDKYYTRSDHYNFAKNGIPVVFFCSGEHEDYHQVSDTPDKLDGPKMERIAQLAYWVGCEVANAKEIPKTLGRKSDWHQ